MMAAPMGKAAEALRAFFRLAALDYSPSQPRDKHGRFTAGSGSGKISGTKYAPSPQRSHKGVQLNPKTYAKLTGILNTRFPGLEAGERRKIRDAAREYLVEADGYGGFTVIEAYKIK